MFAIVRTGGKQYRVAAGDKIAVEKLAGVAGDKVSLGDVLLAGDGDKTQDVNGLTVSAEIIAQERSEKVIVFKKRRRHNYRRKQGHRQSLTLLRILSVGQDEKKSAPARAAKTAAPQAAEPVASADAAPVVEATPVADAAPKKSAALKKPVSSKSETAAAPKEA